MVLIIGISGKKGAGKDYMVRNVLAPMFVRHGYRVTTMAFADALKVFLCAGRKSTMNHLYAEQKTAHVRKLLQYVGTDMIRKSHGEDWWIRQLDAWIDVRLRRDPVDIVFVPDVRFKNEHAWIRQKGGMLLRVVADVGVNDTQMTQSGYTSYVSGLFKSLWYGTDATAQHRSETELNDSDFEHTVANPRDGSSSHVLMTALSEFEAEAIFRLRQ